MNCQKDKPDPCKCGAKKSTTLNQKGSGTFIKCESCNKESKHFNSFPKIMTATDNPVQNAIDDWNNSKEA